MLGTLLTMFTKFIVALIFCAVIFGVYFGIVAIIKWYEKRKKS